MSIEHKAFVFDIDGFNHELRPILELAISAMKYEPIRDFIIHNKMFLVDPYEGEPLDEYWEEMIEDADVHQYGDFAITKYYSPIADGGLGYDWEYVKHIFDVNYHLPYSPVLGTPLGREVFFDPGKLGSYFQTYNDVIKSLNLMNEIEKNISEDNFSYFKNFKNLLEKAVVEKKGLYVTF